MRLSRSFTAGVLCGSALAITTGEQQVVLSDGADEQPASLNVAIIGAGAAGSSSAYHLAKFATSSGLAINVTVFERNPYIGGRSTTVNAYDDPDHLVELGASIFVQVNQILVDAVRDFDLSTGTLVEGTTQIPGPDLAVWDGQKSVLTLQGENSWWDNAKILWKYGLAPIRTKRLMRSTVSKFLKMYEEPHFPFASLSLAAEQLDLLSATAATAEQYMSQNGITGAFPHDVVQASTRVNYAQNLNYINGLLGMVCMATDGAMSVRGGNWRIFDHMLAAANATVLLETEVTSIKRQGDGAYSLTSIALGGLNESVKRTQSFDAVILAAPYQYADLTFNETIMRTPDKIPYVQLHVTLLTSPHLLSPVFFNMAPDDPAPKVVLTTLPMEEQPKEGAEGCGSPGFFSISLLRSIMNPRTQRQEYLYKVFSPAPPNSTFLRNMLGIKQMQDGSDISDHDISWMYRKVWNSYPYEFPRVTFESIELAENLWYTSGIESFISTMETSALMGKNVARMVVDRWREKNSRGSLEGAMRTPSFLSERSVF